MYHQDQNSNINIDVSLIFSVLVGQVFDIFLNDYINLLIEIIIIFEGTYSS